MTSTHTTMFVLVHGAADILVPFLPCLLRVLLKAQNRPSAPSVYSAVGQSAGLSCSEPLGLDVTLLWPKRFNSDCPLPSAVLSDVHCPQWWYACPGPCCGGFLWKGIVLIYCHRIKWHFMSHNLLLYSCSNTHSLKRACVDGVVGDFRTSFAVEQYFVYMNWFMGHIDFCG